MNENVTHEQSETLISPLEYSFAEYTAFKRDLPSRIVSSGAVECLRPDEIMSLDPNLTISSGEFFLESMIGDKIEDLGEDLQPVIKLARELRQRGYKGILFSAKHCQEALETGLIGDTESYDRYYEHLQRRKIELRDRYIIKAVELYRSLGFTANPNQFPDVKSFLEMITDDYSYKGFIDPEMICTFTNNGSLRVLRTNGIECYYFEQDVRAIETIKKALEGDQFLRVHKLLGRQSERSIQITFASSGISRSCAGPMIFIDVNDPRGQLTLRHELTHFELRHPKDGHNSYSQAVEEGCASLISYLSGLEELPSTFYVPDEELKACFDESEVFNCTVAGVQKLTHTGYLREVTNNPDLDNLTYREVYERSYGHGTLLMEFIYNQYGGIQSIINIHDYTSQSNIISDEGVILIKEGIRYEGFRETALIEYALRKMGINVEEFKTKYFEYKEKRLSQLYPRISIKSIN